MMKKRQQTINLNAAQTQLESLRKCAGDMGAEEVLFRLNRSFDDFFTPLVRDLAHQVHGHPEVAPDVFIERAAYSRQRATEASGRAAATFERLRETAAARRDASPMMSWRPALALAIVAAVIGLCLPAPGWRICAVLALSSALAVLALPLIPGAVRSSVLAVRDTVSCLRDLWVAASASRECRRFERRGWAAADHRARIDEWVDVHMHQLAAAYEYQKGLAVAATTH